MFVKNILYINFMKTNLITGSVGFIGFSLCKQLLERGDIIIGIDNHNDYYDPKIKDARLDILNKFPNYKHYRSDISDQKNLEFSKIFINPSILLLIYASGFFNE